MSTTIWYCTPCHRFNVQHAPCEACGRYRGSLRQSPSSQLVGGHPCPTPAVTEARASASVR